MVIVEKSGLPVGLHVCSASPSEVTLVDSVLENRFTDEMPLRLIGDKAYDSDPLDEYLEEIGIEMISPHKINRVKPPTQDGRPPEEI
jgi:hypothetical protein